MLVGLGSPSRVIVTTHNGPLSLIFLNQPVTSSPMFLLLQISQGKLCKLFLIRLGEIVTLLLPFLALHSTLGHMLYGQTCLSR